MDDVRKVREHGRFIIEAELERLSRRRPTLTPSQLAAIESALVNVLDEFVVARLKRLAASRPDLVPAAAELLDPVVRLPQ